MNWWCRSIDPAVLCDILVSMWEMDIPERCVLMKLLKEARSPDKGWKREWRRGWMMRCTFSLVDMPLSCQTPFSSKTDNVEPPTHPCTWRNLFLTVTEEEMRSASFLCTPQVYYTHEVLESLFSYISSFPIQEVDHHNLFSLFLFFVSTRFLFFFQCPLTHILLLFTHLYSSRESIMSSSYHISCPREYWCTICSSIWLVLSHSYMVSKRKAHSVVDIYSQSYGHLIEGLLIVFDY